MRMKPVDGTKSNMLLRILHVERIPTYLQKVKDKEMEGRLNR